MKRSLGPFPLFMSLFVLTAAYGSQTARVGQPSLSITISASQTVVKAGSPVKVEITMKNISTHDVPYYVNSAFGPYDIYVRGASGKLAPETPAGARMHPWSPNNRWRGGTIASFPFRIQPGKKQVTEVDLTKEYDLSQPGEYTVQVERRNPENPAKRLKSNTITVTVTP